MQACAPYVVMCGTYTSAFDSIHVPSVNAASNRGYILSCIFIMCTEGGPHLIQHSLVMMLSHYLIHIFYVIFWILYLITHIFHFLVNYWLFIGIGFLIDWPCHANCCQNLILLQYLLLFIVQDAVRFIFNKTILLWNLKGVEIAYL